MQPTKRQPRAPLLSIFSDAGMGKTTLACMFPGKTLLVRCEDGLESVPDELQPDVLDVCEKPAQIFNQLKWLAEGEHDYNVVVLDSASAAHRMFERAILDSDPKKPIALQHALGGYGAGNKAAENYHQRVRVWLGRINARGIAVVVICHAEPQEFSPPDGDAYTRWNVKLPEKCRAPYVDDVDFVGFIKLESFVKSQEGQLPGKAGKAISTGGRVIVCHATANNISKNRYGIKEEITFPEGENPLLPWIPYYSYLFANEPQEASQE